MRFKIVLVTLGVFSLALLIIIIAFYQPDIPFETLKTKYASAPSRFVEVMNMQVHYRDEGAGSDSIPLVLLHGTASSLHTWSACAKEWTKTHRVLRMDLPGFGLTGPHPEHNYSIYMYVAFLAAFLEETNVEQCYLAGNSLGGLIAYQFIPTLVIWGELDQLIPVANAYKFSRDLPDDSLVVLPDVGHVPMEESPQLIIPLVNGFIKETLH